MKAKYITLFLSLLSLVLSVALMLTAPRTARADEVMAASARLSKGVVVCHDDDRAVTCWLYSHPSSAEGGIACLPDSQLVLSAKAKRREELRRSCAELDVSPLDCEDSAR